MTANAVKSPFVIFILFPFVVLALCGAFLFPALTGHLLLD